MASLWPQAIAETRAVTISNVSCSTQLASRRSGIAAASRAHTASLRSTCCSNSKPPSDDWLPPAKSTVSFLRQTAAKSKGMCDDSPHDAGVKYKMTRQYLEDFVVGQIFSSGQLRVNKEAIIAFAGQFDPQPFHLDEEAARKSVFGGLAASGWHTAALTMRLLVESEFRPADGILGVGFDELSWPRPVRPGDELHTKSEVLDVRPSKSRPDRGLIRVRTTTFNQNGEAVQIFTGNLIVPRRPTDARL